MLRTLLTYAKHDDGVERLVAESHESPQRAFVSASLRPYLLASLLDSDPELRAPEHALIEAAVQAAYGADALEPIPA